MKIEITIGGKDGTEETFHSLEDWLIEEHLPDTTVKRTLPPSKSGEMGMDPASAILTVVLGSKAMVELVRALQEWIKQRKPSLSVKFRSGGRSVEIHAENFSQLDAKLLETLGN